MQESRCAQLYQKYRIESQIGRGASGVCYRVQNIKTKEVCAMKKIHVTSIKRGNTKEACSQVQILRRINHQNVIKLHEFFADEGYVYIIMQYASKGDLHQILKRRKIKRQSFTEVQIWQMAKQLLNALEYLHKSNIIHRDVKTLNIFMDGQSRLYLGDLGVSKILKADAGLYSRVGTPLYLAPEIIKNEKYDYKADIWGLGCVCYHIAALSHPFQGKNIISLGQNIVTVTPKYIEEYSATLNQFLLDMLEKNPRKRLGATDLLKKYFQSKPNYTLPKNLDIKAEKNERLEIKSQTIGLQGMNKISGQNFLAPRINYQKKKIFNNFLDDKLSFHQEDQIKEEEFMKVNKNVGEDSRALDQTIILAKKGEMPDQTKKFVEVTRKTYMISRTDNVQSIKKTEKQVEAKSQLMPVLRQKDAKNNLLSINSEKRMIPTSIDESFKFSKNNFPSYNSFQRQQTKPQEKLQTNAIMQKLSSETGLLPSKARMRPKSSIMTKQRHQSTMRNIRKHYKKAQIEDSDNFVEMCILKKPEVIIL